MTSERPSAEQIVSWTKTLSNWGRWGADDARGTLNLITPDVRLRGLAAAVTGECVPCGREIDVSNPATLPVARRYMLATGESATGTPRSGGTADELHLRPHSLDLTHLDALSHASWDSRMYNDRPAGAVTVTAGATQLGIETAGDGIVTRGVLLDVAAARGVPSLEPGSPVFPKDLEAAEERQGIRVESGDAAILNTGFARYRDEHPDWNFYQQGAPGWQAACLPWLHEREVALIAHDGPGECFPTGYDVDTRTPIHSVGIPAMGLSILDNCDLTALANACDAAGRWAFLFMVAPLRFLGATASPVNPLAIL